MTRIYLSTKVRLQIFLKAQGQCQSCRSKITPGQYWDLDHIIPKALGGSNNLSNLQILCRVCHRTKTARHDVPRIAKFKRQRARHLGAINPLPSYQAHGARHGNGKWMEPW